MDLKKAHFNMVQKQIRPCNVVDKNLLDALMTCPREVFVPQGYQSLAFSDVSIPLINNQFMLSPIVIGKALQFIKLNKSEVVLEIGTGSGYLTALLSMLAYKVISIEINRALYEQARKRLQTLAIKNVEILHGDAMQNLHYDKLFNVVVITGSMPFLPSEFINLFINLLCNGGRLFVTLGQDPIMTACLFNKIESDRWSKLELFETNIPPLLNIPVPEKFEF